MAGEVRIDDGHSTRICFTLIKNAVSKEVEVMSPGSSGADPSVLYFWVKEVTPPGMNGGGPNDTTNMHNELMRTNSPKKLITATPMQANVGYHPKCLDKIKLLINVNQPIYVVYPDLTYHTVWGWLNNWNPGVCKEGSPPEAAIEIEPSNQDRDGNEVEPTFTGLEAPFDFDNPPSVTL